MIKFLGSVRLRLKPLWNIIRREMKTVWMALMAICIPGWILLLFEGLDRYDIYGLNLGSIICWVLSATTIAIGVYAFHKASKIGKREDEIARGR